MTLFIPMTWWMYKCSGLRVHINHSLFLCSHINTVGLLEVFSQSPSPGAGANYFFKLASIQTE